ncbi:cytosolic arginine sensor for mTORC1 subunit 1 isoform X1 [Clarias gariepinus]|uniref:cytosolic arginine sensor for mTORC1 subunit 1 isoform X1 n=1 Tax=Clarias gariepinus TaxID=13013 RepID=UPI00234C21CB|nr:cytosolic arginine sensor for mTORC1 subunit 1 isoform X1 [Clarias gariepinus]
MFFSVSVPSCEEFGSRPEMMQSHSHTLTYPKTTQGTTNTHTPPNTLWSPSVVCCINQILLLFRWASCPFCGKTLSWSVFISRKTAHEFRTVFIHVSGSYPLPWHYEQLLVAICYRFCFVTPCLISSDSPNPSVFLLFRCKFFSLTETPENYTVVLDEEGFKDLPPSEHLKVESSTWLPLNVVSNGNASSSSQAVGVTKIAKSVIAPLAEQHVSVFMLSTYQTDFILVREKDLPVVIHTLAEEFTIFREVDGESVLVHGQDVNNGLQGNGREVPHSTLHPVLIPKNQFCVMSLDPDMLPRIATTLIDVLFYSNSPKEDASVTADLECKFFSFSLIDGYISLVMDTEAQRQFPADLLFTSSSGELWRMVRIGGQPLGFDECGIVAQISQPLADCDISAYYISTFSFDHALVPEEDIARVTDMLQNKRKSVGC